MARGGVFEAKLHGVRRDVEQLDRAMRSLSSHLQLMRSISKNWDKAVDALQVQLNQSLKEAIVLRGETQRVIGVAESLIRSGPSAPPHNVRPGQRSAPPIGLELRGQIQRLQRNADQLDRDLRAYFGKVNEMANHPLRHAAGADVAEAAEPVASLIATIGDVVEIFRGFAQKNRS
jgi:hypothetical protein